MIQILCFVVSDSMKSVPTSSRYVIVKQTDYSAPSNSRLLAYIYVHDVIGDDASDSQPVRSVTVGSQCVDDEQLYARHV